MVMADDVLRTRRRSSLLALKGCDFPTVPTDDMKAGAIPVRLLAEEIKTYGNVRESPDPRLTAATRLNKHTRQSALDVLITSEDADNLQTWWRSNQQRR
jgi:hypothetical protein